MLRAYDKQSGAQVGEVLMPAPITYSHRLVRRQAELRKQFDAIVLFVYGERLPQGRGYRIHLKRLDEPLTGDAAHGEQAASVLAACRSMGFVEDDAQLLARAWTAQARRTGGFDLRKLRERDGANCGGVEDCWRRRRHRRHRDRPRAGPVRAGVLPAPQDVAQRVARCRLRAGSS